QTLCRPRFRNFALRAIPIDCPGLFVWKLGNHHLMTLIAKLWRLRLVMASSGCGFWNRDFNRCWRGLWAGVCVFHVLREEIGCTRRANYSSNECAFLSDLSKRVDKKSEILVSLFLLKRVCRALALRNRFARRNVKDLDC